MRTETKKNMKWGALAVTLLLLAMAVYGGSIVWQSVMKPEDVVLPSSSENAKYERGEWSLDEEGKDERTVPEDTLAAHKVPSDQPRALYIDKLKIAARVFPMSTHKDGTIQAPLNIFDAGWYVKSAKPGESGATFIDAHASGATREGLFAYLDTLVAGDFIELEKGDGERVIYKVAAVEKVALDKVDMKKALAPYGDAEQSLTLMTCTGKWLKDEATYDHRAIVYAMAVK